MSSSNIVGTTEKEEYLKSERPAIQQLKAMGYDYKSQSELNKERRDYREVLLYDRLEAAIRKHNPELDEDGVYEALSEVNESKFPYTLDMMDTNEKARAKLVGLSRSEGGLEPITVTQNFGKGNIEKTVRLFDFDNPENNDFLVTNQFQLDGLKQPIFPDIVVFVNGIPLVVIECKSPYIKDPINEAVEKNFQRYQSRGEGYERLMFYNHFLIATCGTLARHGNIGASVNHYAKWSEAYPLTEEEIGKKMYEGRKPREQEILIAGMLSKSHIVDLLKNYVIYETYGNKKIKKLAKHQQYRVVTKAVERLNLEEEENIADKGGVIWHTQGSGKSLSMLWLATQLMFRFGNPPIVLVTDRKQLDEQIHGTFKACGFPDPISAKSRRHLQQLLSNPRGKTIMTTIQKFGSKESHIHTDEKVIALVDEGHRSQYKFNAEAMRSSMPNAVFFAFSGTPIDKKNKSTYKVFGPLLDKYSFEESKQDGATLKILYESRMPDLYVEGADSINQIFDRVFSDLEQEKKDRLKKEYVTKEKIAEAPSRIRKICLDLIDHYTKRIEPNGYKAMLVATSREAAVAYKRELDKLNAPKSKIIMTSHLGEKGKDGRSSWDEYFLTPEQREDEADRFKSPDDPTKILIVVDMLLVGYDVPIVQVMYLDKGLREHTLLQAIARVNRLDEPPKTYGLIVDYCGITKDLQKALAIFEEDDIKGALEPAEKELEELRIRHREAVSFFNDIDKEGQDVDGAIIEKFEPVNLRDDFEYAFKMFSKALDVILPKKEADPFIADFKYLSEKRQLIRTYYEGVRHSLRVDGKKVQQLIDDHIRSLDIAELMNPREVTYENFLGHAAKFKSERARTALVKNKARQIIKELAPTNPVYYEKLRERLEKIIEEEERRRIKDASYFNKLKGIYNEALNPEKERKKLGFSTQFEFAVYELLLQSLKKDENSSRDITNAIFAKVKEEAGIVGWKTKRSSEKKMNTAIYDILSDNNYTEDKANELAMKIIELAKKDL
ncbi:MAG TPA: type I restriction endonuclease subunit R [Nitrososphaeraceae archaeon]|nr:type I restriction endonuclease subunit R [Nitrososphaeraceae archaeon]